LYRWFAYFRRGFLRDTLTLSRVIEAIVTFLLPVLNAACDGGAGAMASRRNLARRIDTDIGRLPGADRRL